MRLCFLHLSFFFIALATTSLNAADIRRLDGSTVGSAEIDAKVTSLMKDAEVTGVAIAILDHGKVAYLKTYGFRDTEKKLPLTPDTVMYAASFTKSTFAYAAMQWVERGVLDLEKPVYEYLPKPLPEYPGYEGLANDPRYKRITARMLLSHTSGFANLRWLEEDHKLKIHFEPGSRYAYSGEGLRLLQLVVETITGKPIETLMQESVFQPFGMSRTSMVWQTAFDSDYANGYDESGKSLGPEKRTKADAAGSMQTTISDFARFMVAVMKGERLKPKTREDMLSPKILIPYKHQFPTLASDTTDENKRSRLSYGLGWGLYWTPYGRAFFKEGHDDGWRHYTVCFDDPKTGIVIMTNSGNGEGIFKYLLDTTLGNTFTPIEWEGYTPYDQLPPRPPVVSKAAQVQPTPASQSNASNLAMGQWRLTTIAEKQVTSVGRQQPYLKFERRDHTVTGFTGCNRLRGSYEAGETTLAFKQIVSTRMACVGTNYEQQFLDALNSATEYKVTGHRLDLIHDNKVLATFARPHEEQTQQRSSEK